MGSRIIGEGAPCFVIAEAGVNHNGDLDLARRLIDAAATAGADAIKFQTFKAEKLVTPAAEKAQYQKETTGGAESQLEMLRRLELDADAHRALIAHSRARGILFLSTPFEEESADLLAELDVPGLKLASGEVTNLPFLAQIARKNRPVLLSTGMSLLSEVEVAVDTLRKNGAPGIALLQCVSSYPAAAADVNLRAMATMRTAFNLPTGYSDHTAGIEVALAAAALGACIIEKHLTTDRTLPGPDHQASLEPAELAAMVRGIRMVESALGSGIKRPATCELEQMKAGRKSLVAARAIAAGSVLTADMFACKRPGTGLAPAMLPHLVGRRVKRDLAANEPFAIDVLG